MEIPEWIIPPFDVEVESPNLDTFLKEEFIQKLTLRSPDQ